MRIWKIKMQRSNRKKRDLSQKKFSHNITPFPRSARSTVFITSMRPSDRPRQRERERESGRESEGGRERVRGREGQQLLQVKGETEGVGGGDESANTFSLFLSFFISPPFLLDITPSGRDGRETRAQRRSEDKWKGKSERENGARQKERRKSRRPN